MFGRLMPREGNFFELFNAHAERIVEGSRELAAMMTTFNELEPAFIAGLAWYLGRLLLAPSP
jgi:hypothetical protein